MLDTVLRATSMKKIKTNYVGRRELFGKKASTLGPMGLLHDLYCLVAPKGKKLQFPKCDRTKDILAVEISHVNCEA